MSDLVKRMSEFEFNYLFTKYKYSSLNCDKLRKLIVKENGKYHFNDLCELVRKIKNFQVNKYGSGMSSYDPIMSYDKNTIIRAKTRNKKKEE